MSSVGQVLGYAVGAVVGFFVPAIGIPLGMAIGGAIGTAIDPPKGPTIEGPRLSDLTQQGASYGAVIPRIYGSVAMAGTVFWIENNSLKETSETEESGGKGGGGQETKTYKYSATFALALCEGPIAGVRRVWCNGKLIFDHGSEDLETLYASIVDNGLSGFADIKNGGITANAATGAYTLYLGTEDQEANPRMQATIGVANCPAYRGLAYLVIEDFDLTDYGNTLVGAQFKVEVLSSAVYDQTVVERENVYTNNGDTQALAARPYYIGADCIKYAAPQWTTTYPATSTYIPYTLYPDGAFFIGARVDCNGSDVPPTQSTDGEFIPSGIDIFGGVTPGDSGAGTVVKCGGIYAILSPPLIRSSTGDGTSIDIAADTDDYAIATDGNFIYVAGSNSSRKYTSTLSLVETGVALPTPGIVGTSLAAIDASTGQFCVLPYPGSTKDLYRFSTDLASVELIGTLTGLNNIGYYSGNMFVQGDLVIVAFGGTTITTPKKLWAYYFALNVIGNDSVTLASIVSAECLKSNLLLAGDINVTSLVDLVKGYRIASAGSLRGGIDPLQGAWPFDVVQAGYKVKFIRRGVNTSIATVPQTDLAASSDNKSPVMLRRVREMDSQIPWRVEITHLDFSRDYDLGTQYAERLNTDSVNTLKLEMPIVMTSAEAAQKAEILLYMYWLERHDFAFSLPPSYGYIEPGDVITVQTDTATYTLRLTQIEYQADGVLSCQARFNNADGYTSTVTGATPDILPVSTIHMSGPIVYDALDVPTLVDEYDQPSYLAAMSSINSAWNGANLYRSFDGGQNWVFTNGFSTQSKIGYADGAISTPITFSLIDKASVLNVVMYGSSTLSSVTESQMLNGANHFAYGVDGRWEIIAAQTCTLNSAGHYALTDLLRGRQGTEWAASLHTDRDHIILLNSARVQYISTGVSQIGLSSILRGVPTGKTIDSASDTPFTYTAVNLKPLSPVYAKGYKNASNDWSIEWMRRTRVGGALRDNVDATLSEASEAYEVEIYSSNTYATLKRTITGLTSPAATYTSAQQTTDFGSAQTQLWIKIYQVSATVGRGYPLAASVPFNGGTLSLVHFDSTEWKDEIGGATSNINAQLSASYPKFGGNGLYLNSNGRFVTAPINATALEDFTIEFWYKGPSMATPIFDAKNGLYWYNGDLYINNISVCSGINVGAINSATHCAVTRKNSVVKVFIGGVQIGTTGSSSFPANLAEFTLGYFYGGPIYAGAYYDELRISNTCLYENEFVPPEAPFILPTGAY